MHGEKTGKRDREKKIYKNELLMICIFYLVASMNTVQNETKKQKCTNLTRSLAVVHQVLNVFVLSVAAPSCTASPQYQHQHNNVELYKQQRKETIYKTYSSFPTVTISSLISRIKSI